MEKLNQNIKNHYLKEELYEDIVNRLKEQDIDLNKVAVAAGLATIDHEDQISNPYIGRRFGLAAVTSSLAMKVDEPLDAQAGLSHITTIRKQLTNSQTGLGGNISTPTPTSRPLNQLF